MTANLYERNSYYYVKLYWYQGSERKQKNISTGVPVKGNNKRKAEQFRKELLDEWQEKVEENHADILFSDYLIQWLESVKTTIAEETFNSYSAIVNKQLAPYFKKLGIWLVDIKPHHIQKYYTWKMKTDNVSANTIRHYHANIHAALKAAMKLRYIKENPAALVDLPKVDKFCGDFYTADELRNLIDKVKGTKFEAPVLLASWLGMRRSEIIGIKWSAINFNEKTLHIKGTVSEFNDKAKAKTIRFRPFIAKNTKSIRAFPLTDNMITYLKSLQKRQWENRVVAETSYNTDWIEFVCVDNVGDLIKPSYISRYFPEFLEKNGLRRIRFHDLRHTNATLLLEEGISLKDLQDWLGHKSYSTTADTYSHVQAKTKQKLADTISKLVASS